MAYEFLNHEYLYLTCKTKAEIVPGHFPCKNEQIQTTRVQPSMTLLPSGHFWLIAPAEEKYL